METQLLSFEYRTEHPEDLENFLSEVLQLDIKSSSTGLFSVQFGNIVMDVVQGTSLGGTMQVALAPENFNDLPARWEFFPLQRAAHCELCEVFGRFSDERRLCLENHRRPAVFPT